MVRIWWRILTGDLIRLLFGKNFAPRSGPACSGPARGVFRFRSRNRLSGLERVMESERFENGFGSTDVEFHRLLDGQLGHDAVVHDGGKTLGPDTKADS